MRKLLKVALTVATLPVAIPLAVPIAVERWQTNRRYLRAVRNMGAGAVTTLPKRVEE